MHWSSAAWQGWAAEHGFPGVGGRPWPGTLWWGKPISLLEHAHRHDLGLGPHDLSLNHGQKLGCDDRSTLDMVGLCSLSFLQGHRRKGGRRKRVKKNIAWYSTAGFFVLCSTREKKQPRGMGMWFSYCIDLTANSDSVSSPQLWKSLKRCQHKISQLLIEFCLSKVLRLFWKSQPYFQHRAPM